VGFLGLRFLECKARFFILIGFSLVLILNGCSVDSARNHYLLAEKLWADQKYPAAVTEFEKVISKGPRSKLGQQASYRAAMTQYLFLSQYSDAIRRFKSFIESSTDLQLIWNAQLQIGEILFSKLEQYDQAMQHYQTLLKSKMDSPEAPELLYRIGKSQFYLFQFNDAVKSYQELIQKYPRSKWAEKADFEIGATYFTRGEQRSEGQESGAAAYEVAMEAYEQFIKRHPKSDRISEARFGIASCLEELDRLDEAYRLFEELKKTYPAPHVVDVKLTRIRQRLVHRGSVR
jgi:outer membrane protein assembly factor BamD